jgi:hypothetical protein
MTETKTLRGAAAAVAMVVIGAAGFLFGHGCGSVSNDRDEAINQAATATCSRYQACGAIGTAGAPATVSDCQNDWKATFTKQWPPAQCQGRIDQSMLSLCVQRINSTECTSILDILNTLYVVCSEANVCDVHDAGTGG